MPLTPPTALVATLAVSALAFAGCGDSGSSTSTVTGGKARADGGSIAASGGESSPATPADPTLPGGSAEREAPKGASPVLRSIYRQFSQPRPNPAVVGSATAIEAGETVCKGKTPLQVKEAFYSQAVEAGSLEAGSGRAKLIAMLPSFEERAASDPGFTAGQLAADTYEATLPEAIARYGYQGCIYSLALRLKRELAPKGSG